MKYQEKIISRSLLLASGCLGPSITFMVNRIFVNEWCFIADMMLTQAVIPVLIILCIVVLLKWSKNLVIRKINFGFSIILSAWSLYGISLIVWLMLLGTKI